MEVLIFAQAFLIPLHEGYVEQPQNCPPAFAPRFAFLRTIVLPHFGHEVVPKEGSLAADRTET